MEGLGKGKEEQVVDIETIADNAAGLSPCFGGGVPAETEAAGTGEDLKLGVGGQEGVDGLVFGLRNGKAGEEGAGQDGGQSAACRRAAVGTQRRGRQRR